ncbi:MAG: hypothetical protein RIQ93_1372 [Verrucomicrobiota bacterium]|jgi:Rad3-related DNA helicase
MNFDLDKRTVALSVGEFADFTLGPRDGTGAPQGLWRAQLGTHWHNELKARATAEHGTAVEFEIPITGQVFHRGWTFALTGRIDQVLRHNGKVTLREIKSVTRELPADETELRADYPEYFVQLASYGTLARIGQPLGPAAGGRTLDLGGDDVSRNVPARDELRTELVFVEVDSGLAQTIALTPADDALFRTRLEEIAQFLDLRARARERLRGLRFRPAFAVPRPGQETTQAELSHLFERHPLVLFEAPTGFGKTGVLLEFALGQLRSGHFDRALYLTSKSTGQLQVMRTLVGMTAMPAPGAVNAAPGPATAGVAAWHVRNKSEHCVNHTFHCVRDNCAYLKGAATRWRQSGLARFYLDEHHARDLDTLRAAGQDAQICPYEITRATLAFNDVWVGDYNYVFSPRNRGLFFGQPGFDPARTLLLLDEAHNLPSRVADVYSHGFSAAEAFATRDELHRNRASAMLVRAWDHWSHCLHHLCAKEALSPAEEEDVRHLLREVAAAIPSAALDFAALHPVTVEHLWQIPSMMEELDTSPLPRLWWCPRDRELALTCLDAASAIGATLREFGGVVLASATLTPVDGFAAACGLDAPPEIPVEPAPSVPERLGTLTKRDTRKLYKQLTSAAELLRVEEARETASPAVLRAHTPWRDHSYAVAFDARVDTTFQHRALHYTTTAATVAALQNAARGVVAVFFPSYAYADALARELATVASALRVAVQPKLRDLTAQSNWMEEALRGADALFLVLGSSFAESIDALGGRISHAMVVGPALPEVNAVQRARLADAAHAGLTREAAFRRVYQVPGMMKVNQALGRLVRAPGQKARILLHCRRFLEPGYQRLLAQEYRSGTNVVDDVALATWLSADAPVLPAPDSNPGQ